MDQNTKIIIGIALLGGAYYLYTRKKPEAVVVNTGGVKNSLTGCKNIQTIPCLKAPCPQRCADNDLPQNVGMNTSITGAKNACGQTIPTNVPCFKDLDNNGKCYDNKGNEVDLTKMPMGFTCFNKNGTSRNVSNIAV
jgi:hypothetical protein